ncbi:MAG: tyrosine-type recombinase/integrase [Nitrosopumilus sp.]|jgi:integrase/recombinase XerD
MSTKQVQTTKEITIHDFAKSLDHTLKAIECLSSRNTELIKKYDKEMVRNSLAKGTRLKHLLIILNLSRMLEKDWEDVTKQDIEELVFQFIQKYSPNGKETHHTWDHKKILKIFFRWVKLGSRNFRDVGNPDETKWIRLNRVKSNIVREQLITDEDISKILKSCINPRDKAFFDVHYEAGTRPGEILSLKIKNVKFDKFGAFINVDGKTGSRPIRLVKSVPNLANWLNVHPQKEDPESPVWIILEKPKFGEPMKYHTATSLLKRTMKRAGINKHFNLKLFRHSEATNSAKFMTEAQMKIRHGWTNDSKMPANYVHLVNSDVDEVYLKHLGIKSQEEEIQDLPRKCTICSMMNSSDSSICTKCGKPLDLKKAMELEEKASQENFMANKLAGKVLVQMLVTGQIPKLSKDEINSLIQSLNL